MSGFLSPAQIFNPPAQAAPTPVQPAQGASNQLPPQASSTAATDIATQTAGTESKLPMDEFNTLFAPPVDKDGKPIQNAGDAPLFTYNPAAMMEAAKKMDFTSGIDPALLQKVGAGGEEGIKAMIQIMNAVGQDAFAKAAVAAAKLTEHGLNGAETRFKNSLPTFVKSQQASEGLQSEAILQHPSVAPLVDTVKSQIMTKFPDATSAQIKEMTVKYFQNFAKSFAPQPSESASNTPGSRKVDSTNWSNWFST